MTHRTEPPDDSTIINHIADDIQRACLNAGRPISPNNVACAVMMTVLYRSILANSGLLPEEARQRVESLFVDDLYPTIRRFLVNNGVGIRES